MHACFNNNNNNNACVNGTTKIVVVGITLFDQHMVLHIVHYIPIPQSLLSSYPYACVYTTRHI